jgi:hypothetical chaperone protein
MEDWTSGFPSRTVISKLGFADDLTSIEQAVDSLLRNSSLPPRDVDRVFLTGGSSFVPAVRRIFTSRFGKDKIRRGHEFTSVAHGLALRALENADAARIE